MTPERDTEITTLAIDAANRWLRGSNTYDLINYCFDRLVEEYKAELAKQEGCACSVHSTTR